MSRGDGFALLVFMLFFGDLLEKSESQEGNVVIVWLGWHLGGISMRESVLEAQPYPGQGPSVS